MAVIMYFCWYYPVGLYRNALATDELAERGALMFLFLWMFMLFTGTFSTLIIAGFETAEAGANLANLVFMLTLIFCGALVSPDNLPRFWIFMYRVSPLTYLVSGMLSVGVANTDVVCASNEILTFKTLTGKSCEEYLSDYINIVGGALIANPEDPNTCKFCYINKTNKFLEGVSSNYADRWRNFGILWGFIVFNIFAALFVYWLARMPKKSLGSKSRRG